MHTLIPRKEDLLLSPVVVRKSIPGDGHERKATTGITIKAGIRNGMREEGKRMITPVNAKRRGGCGIRDKMEAQEGKEMGRKRHGKLSDIRIDDSGSLISFFSSPPASLTVQAAAGQSDTA